MIICQTKKVTIQDCLNAALLVLDLAIEKIEKPEVAGTESEDTIKEKRINELKSIKTKIMKFR